MTECSQTLNRDIVAAIEAVANPAWQEDFDNTGWQTGNPDAHCSGVMLCVDVTSEIVSEAAAKGCNLIISHHPLLFRGIKSVIPSKGRVEKVLTELIRNDISLYSSHTALDSTPAPFGISYAIAENLGLENISPLTTEPGLGVIGELSAPISLKEFAMHVKHALGANCVRLSVPSDGMDCDIRSVALCGGAGIEFIDDAIAKGADLYITSDIKLNWFLDRRDSIKLLEIGHYEAEKCARDIFFRILGNSNTGVPVFKSVTERNPVIYI